METRPKPAADRPISELDIGLRLTIKLTKTGIRTLTDLLEFSCASLYRYRCFGETDIGQIEDALDELGLRLPDQSAPWIIEAQQSKNWADLIEMVLLRRLAERTQPEVKKAVPRRKRAGLGPNPSSALST